MSVKEQEEKVQRLKSELDAANEELEKDKEEKQKKEEEKQKKRLQEIIETASDRDKYQRLVDSFIKTYSDFVKSLSDEGILKQKFDKLIDLNGKIIEVYRQHEIVAKEKGGEVIFKGYNFVGYLSAGYPGLLKQTIYRLEGRGGLEIPELNEKYGITRSLI